jgi:prophage tail gpP-like protein
VGEIVLLVGGKRYRGWTSARVTRSIESVSGSFSVEVVERWSGQAEPWPIFEEDPVRVEVDGEPVIDGYVEQRMVLLEESNRSVTITGRDRAGALVDCSADLTAWTFRQKSVLDIARKLAAPFGIKVTSKAGMVPKVPKLVVNPSDTAWSVISRAAKMAGVLVVSDGSGNLVLTRSGTDRASALIEGQNALSLQGAYDATQRFSQYTVLTQTPGTGKAAGSRVRARATDEGVRRHRPLIIRPESGMSTAYARRRADWEARTRAARADAVTIGVAGWRQADGDLWIPNARCPVTAPALTIQGEMLISQVEYSIDAGGEVATISLVRPDAFTPEPQLAKVKRSGESFIEWRDPSVRPTK